MVFEIPAYVFVVDTNQYAGSFERELCGYASGMVGECGVGNSEAKKFVADYPGENPFSASIAMSPDEHGCHRPVAIWPTPGRFNNGMGGHFYDGEETKAQAEYRSECLERSREKHYARQEDNEVEARRWEAKAEEPFTKHPAYMSVGIYFTEQLSNELISILVRRSQVFCEKKEIKITGFRLLALSLAEMSVDISEVVSKA